MQLDWYVVVLGTNLHRYQGNSSEQEEPLRSEEINPAVSIYVKRDRRSWLHAVESTLQHNSVLQRDVEISNQTRKYRRTGVPELLTRKVNPDGLQACAC